MHVRIFLPGTTQNDEIMGIIAVGLDDVETLFTENEISRGWCILPHTKNTHKLVITGNKESWPVSQVHYIDCAGQIWHYESLSPITVLPRVVKRDKK